MLPSAFHFWMSLLLAVGSLGALLEFLWGNRHVKRLQDISPVEDAACPSLAIVIAARNEARNLKEALSSVLQLDYPNLRIVLVNDRSTDETGAIADALAHEHARLKVVHIQELPPGWLGKNHALFVGAQATDSELILFTDADIVMRPDTLRRAVRYLQAEKLSLLAITPAFLTPSFWLNLFFPHFTVSFSLYARPWFAQYPQSPYHIGIGAFNLIRRDCYEAIGTHRAIALRPDDDMKLGKLVKKHGYRENCLFGTGCIGVEWYASLPEAINGLMKNAFAGLDYNLPLAVGGALVQLLVFVTPWLGVLLAEGPAQWMYGAAVFFQLLMALDTARAHGLPRWSVLGLPYGAVLMTYIILRGTALNLLQRGIYWRDTFYPLAELRRNQI